MVMDDKDLLNRFEYHKPDAGKATRHEEMRMAMHEAALVVETRCSEGREKSLAITKLEEAMFWANAAIARAD